MKIIKRLGVLFICMCLLGLTVPQKAYAASASVSISKVSGNVGSNVTVTCTISVSGASIGAADVSYSYDTSALQPTSSGGDGWSAAGGGVFYSGYATADGKSSLSFSVTFKILKEGTYPLTLTGADVYDWSDEPISASKKNGSVTGKAVTTSSENQGSNESQGSGTTTQTDTRDKNSALSSLQVSPGTLSPAFSAGTTTYTVTVPNTTTDVTISATPQSSKASVSVSGGKDLKLGANTAKVTVVAENGWSTVYTLNIMCGEEPKFQIDGLEYTIDEAFSDAQVPDGFVKNEFEYEGREYQAVASEKGEMQLLSLKNDTTTAFYIYNEATKEFYPFTQVKFANGRFIVPIPLQDDVKEFETAEQTEITIANLQFDAWKLNEEYSVLCAMDNEGEVVLYQYDSVDGTLQRYAGEIEMGAAEPSEETGQDVADTALEKVYKKGLAFMGAYYVYLIVGLGAALLIVSVAFICYAATRSSKHRAGKKRAQKRKSKKKASVEE